MSRAKYFINMTNSLEHELFIEDNVEFLFGKTIGKNKVNLIFKLSHFKNLYITVTRAAQDVVNHVKSRLW